ncbi:MAG: hypothetical protein KAT10_01560 [Sulfurimonas sp.]|nr:hypothetical protein [Sulfurimonas sp.]
MKIIFLALLLLSYLHSNEMKRIEAIVEDITNLRGDYEKCQAELNGKKSEDQVKYYKDLYEEEKKKNIKLKVETDYTSPFFPSSSSLNKSVEKLEKRVKKQEKLLIVKDNKIKKLLKNSANKCKQVNEFPELMIKKEHKENNSYTRKEKIINFKAKPFQLNVDSNLYNSIDGKKIYRWKRGRSFTSNKKTKTWIQVTGYFINKKWQKSKKEMWIKIVQVSKK